MSEEWLNNFFHNQASFSFSYHRDYYLRQKCNKTVGPTEFFIVCFYSTKASFDGAESNTQTGFNFQSII